MSEKEQQNDELSRLAPDELGGDESLSGPSGNEGLLTAYALGELDDAQRAEIEARLRESTDERQAVDDLARLGKLLRAVAIQSSPASANQAAELRDAVL